jgi:hypothetical protein
MLCDASGWQYMLQRPGTHGEAMAAAGLRTRHVPDSRLIVKGASSCCCYLLCKPVQAARVPICLWQHHHAMLLLLLLLLSSPEKKCMSGCVRMTSLSICSITSLSCRQADTHAHRQA